MTPCRPSCPHGDCANCVSFDRPARCEPAAVVCPQASACARATEPTGCRVIDASIVLHQQSLCPMFIDRRGLALLSAQQAVPA